MSNEAELAVLEKRLGRSYARQRLGIEKDHEAQIFGQGINFFHIENLTPSHALIRGVLMASGLYWRGLSNAAKVALRHNRVASPYLPQAFDGYTILQLSDLHVEMSEAAIQRVIGLVGSVDYDLCILTGDYRAKTYGPYDGTLAGMAKLRAALKGKIYGVLGNHDTICLVPGLEEMNIKVLLNENETIERGGERIHLAGIDDAHFYRVDNIEKAAADIPHEEFSILISHTPEIYRQAAHADFNLLAERPYPWRPDLPSRRHSDHARFGLAAIDGIGALAASRHDRLHLGRRGLLHRSRALQLPSRDHPAPPSPIALKCLLNKGGRAN